MRKILILVVVAAAALLPTAPAGAGGPVAISEVYGGGGNTGASYERDFVELFNRTKRPIDLNGWRVEYASSTGSAWSGVTLAGSIAPYRYYLVSFASGGSGGRPLPTPDARAVANIARSAGKVRLRTASGVVDLVGYGSGVTAYERRPAPTASDNAHGVRRVDGGCTDTDDNRSDFRVYETGPRNTASAGYGCGSPPVLQPVGNKTVAANHRLAFTVSGTDADRDPLRYSASNLPSGATFDPATRTFRWRPTSRQFGRHAGITFTVSDGVERDSEAIRIYVTADPDAETSQTTLKIRHETARLRASGVVSPNHAGHSVTVRLYRYQNGSYVRLQTESVVLGGDSVYAASLDRPRAGSCKVSATFYGDADTNPSVAEALFSC